MKRRGNGEGTFTERKDGKGWQGQRFFPTPSGGMKRVTKYGRTRAEVAAKLDAVAQLVRDGIDPTHRPMTLAQYGEVWFGSTLRSQVELGHNQPSTVQNYRNVWDRYIGPHLGQVRLHELGSRHLREWHALLARTRSAHSDTLLSPRTRLLAHGVLRAALNDAVRDQLIARNPVLLVKAPKSQTKDIVPLTDDETQRLLATTDGTWLHTLVLFMATTGARPGEALGAAWSDIDLDRGTWFISRSLGRVPAHGTSGRSVLAMKPTKTSASTATVKLADVTVTELRRHRRRQAEARLAARGWV